MGFLYGLLLFTGESGLLWLLGVALRYLISARLQASVLMVTSLSPFGLPAHDNHQAAALLDIAQFIDYLGSGI